jgi:Protein of unknown function (DUF2568)
MGDRAGPRPAGAGRAVLLTVRFASELALLAVLAVAGTGADVGVAWRIVLAVVGPALAVAIWGQLIAPRARHRLRDPVRLAVETVLFVVSSAALALAGHVIPAAVFAVLATGIAVLVRIITPDS